jgi:hypothetical protein
VQVNAGATTVEILADGHYPFKQDYVFKGGGTAAITAVLTSEATGALLRVTSAIAGAHVFVDGQPAGLAPAERALESGQHAVRVERDGFHPEDRQIVLSHGEQRTLALDPRAIGLHEKWWFWTTVGAAVVVAGVVLAVALTTEKAGDSGLNFSPGNVQVGAFRF